jgi:short-subunit dehydrogenase
MLAVVTGASRGLERLCARELAAHGADLLLVARDQTALANVAADIKVKYPGREVTVSAEKAARLVVNLTIGKGRDVTGKLISAVWEC